MVVVGGCGWWLVVVVVVVGGCRGWWLVVVVGCGCRWLWRLVLRLFFWCVFSVGVEGPMVVGGGCIGRGCRWLVGGVEQGKL